MTADERDQIIAEMLAALKIALDDMDDWNAYNPTSEKALNAVKGAIAKAEAKGY